MKHLKADFSLGNAPVKIEKFVDIHDEVTFSSSMISLKEGGSEDIFDLYPFASLL